MSHAYARNHLHVIFASKGRRNLISDPDRLWAYMRGIARNYQIDFEAIGGTANHVHILLALPPKLSLSHAMRAIKANSSKWMNENGQRFAWQEGYAAFSVSTSNLQQVAAYVRNQPEHHRHRTFEEEFLALLRKHGIEADPAQVFAEGAALRAGPPFQSASQR
jgi:REP element-mobilizing transposase RayT